MRLNQIHAVKPIVIVVPLIIVASGMACFFLLPMPLGIRAFILVSELVAAGIVGSLFWRRFR